MRYYVMNKKGLWNIFSTVIDDYLYSEFLPFEKMKRDVLEESMKKRNAELDTLLTDKPELNRMEFEEAEDRRNGR